MAKYTVKGTDILYSGKLYAEGSVIELETKESNQLVDYLELIPEVKKETKKQAKEPETPVVVAETPGAVVETSDDGGTQ